MDSNEMHAAAFICGRLAELIRDSVNSYRVVEPTPRQRVAQALLAAGIDHAISLNLLLTKQSPSAAFSAVGIFRMQLDAVSRGIFFARPEFSSDSDVMDFIENDRMPQIQPVGERKRQIRLSELIERVSSFVAELAPGLEMDGTSHRFSYALDEFNGFVHGGSDVVAAYQEHGNFGLIYVPTFRKLVEIAKHATALAHIAEIAQLFYVAALGHVPALSPDREEAHAEFVRMSAKI